MNKIYKNVIIKTHNNLFKNSRIIIIYRQYNSLHI